MTDVVVLDASVLIAAMQPHDAHHRDAGVVLRRGATGSVLAAHSLSIAEAAVGAAQHDQLDQLRRAITALGIDVCLPDEGQHWRLAQWRAATRLPMPDCCVLDLAVQRQGALATFDSRLATIARAHGVLTV